MRQQEGFTLIEVLVAAFLLAVGAVAVTGLIILSSRLSFESERNAVAQGVVNQWIEYVRVLDYDQVALTAAAPDSGLLTDQEINQNGQKYNLSFRVELEDDPGNGINTALDATNADYKKVFVTATWNTAGGGSRSVVSSIIVTRLSNPITCTSGNYSCPGPAGNKSVRCPASGFCPAVQLCNPGERQCFGNTVICPSDGRCPGSPPDPDTSCPAEAYFCSDTTSGGIVLSEFFPDPEGTTDDDEYIEITNTGNGSLDLTGWKLDDGPGGSSPYFIPPGTIIPPGDYTTFDRSDTNIELDNNGDSVRVFDPYWNNVIDESYDEAVEGQSYTWVCDSCGSGSSGGGSNGGGSSGGYGWYPPSPGGPGPSGGGYGSDDYSGSDDYDGDGCSNLNEYLGNC
ncbi:MAG: lamin tail domain-containing protein [Candidatus Andersenbacteria bacterium]|nr:lamin tail domain-containing protein [Candidatus Andersenbacteria bacterium]MBI3250951.1 lamin tail domain-containing protein [Candidatus Andersenbacteria bacterium]